MVGTHYFDAATWARLQQQARQLPAPCLLLHLDTIRDKYQELQQAFAPVQGQVYYALKANPVPEVVTLLGQLGSSFELASVPELELALACGVPAERLCFGNTLKKTTDIARFHAAGVPLYASDSEADIRRLAAHAPGAQVYVRLLIEDDHTADWPLARKFGCDAAMAVELLGLARSLGLVPHGLSFHVGSQQNASSAWQKAIVAAQAIFAELATQGIQLQLLNLGGGFPARYLSPVPTIESLADDIIASLKQAFGAQMPAIMLEPGRYLVAEAGVLVSEVMLVSHKSASETTRWVYLDVGVFGGLTEAYGESTKYPILSDRDGATAEVILAGPTCDGRDILYEHFRYALPLSLQPSDRLYWLAAGAYTTSCSCVGYNGFAPLTVHCL